VAAQYDRGGQPARAVTYYERAARGAQRLFAYEESCVLLQRLLVLVGQVTDGAARARLEFQARVMLSAAIRVLEGWASPRLESMHTRVVELSEQIGTPEERAVARLSYAFFGEVRGEFARVRESLDELRDAAERADSPTLRVMAAAATAGYHVMTGGFATADALYRETASWYEPSQHHAHVALTGADFGVLHRAWTSHALWALGDRDGAVARASQAVDLAVAHAHPFSEALANAYLAMVYQLDGDLDACTRCAARALETATRSRVTYYAAWASILLAWADAVRAPSPSHAARIEACIDEFVSTGAGSRLPYYLALAAEGHRHAGDRSTALDLIERALACSARQGDSWYDAELHRRHAEALADVGRTAEAEIAARRAVELAQAQGARPFEARAEETRARIAANAAANG
jgi:tetratricopeptide (TPR) repeat protein